MASYGVPEKNLSTDEIRRENATDEHLERIETADVDNYHGLTVKTCLVFLAICIQQFSQIFVLVGAGSLSRAMTGTLGGADKGIWLSQAIAIGLATLVAPSAQATDYWGRKWILAFTFVPGIAGSLTIARANTIGQALGGMCILAVMFYAQAINSAVASEIVPRKLRPAAQGILNIANAVGGVAGLLGGANLTRNNPYGWRNYWYVSTALAGASGLIIVVVYNPPARPLQKALTFRQKLACLDWVAYLLLAAGLILFSIGLTWANNPYHWIDAHVLAPFLIGAVILIGLVVHQKFVKKDGLVHHDLFKKDRNFALALLCFFFEGVVFFAANSYFPLQVATLYETNSTKVVLRFAMSFLAALFSSSMIPLVLTFTKVVREPIIASFALILIYFICMATATLSSGTAMWGYPVLLGLGQGWSLSYLVAAAQLSAPGHLIAESSALMYSSRGVGGTVGLAVFTAIFNSKIRAHLAQDVAAAIVPLGVAPTFIEGFISAFMSHNIQALTRIPGVTPDVIAIGGLALRGAYLKSFKAVYIAAAAFTGAVVVACCFFINPHKDFTNHVDAPLDEEIAEPTKIAH